MSFTLEGCRLLSTTTLPNTDGKFLCHDSEYTTGNLGKNWNELDLVPFRITADNGGGNQAYKVVIALDYLNGNCSLTSGQFAVGGAGYPLPDFGAGCRPGYDVISAPALNTSLSSPDAERARSSCSPAGCCYTRL